MCQLRVYMWENSTSSFYCNLYLNGPHGVSMILTCASSLYKRKDTGSKYTKKWGIIYNLCSLWTRKNQLYG